MQKTKRPVSSLSQTSLNIAGAGYSVCVLKGFIEISDVYFNVTRVSPIVKQPSRNFKPQKCVKCVKFLTLCFVFFCFFFCFSIFF